MEKSGEQDIGASVDSGITMDAADVSPRAAKSPGPGFTRFVRIENRRQIVLDANDGESTPERVKPGSAGIVANDNLSPMLRSGSRVKPDQEHKIP